MPRIVPYSEAIETKPAPRRRGRKKQTTEPNEKTEDNNFMVVKMVWGVHILEI